MTSTPSPQNVRLTITVTPEVHETFQRFAKAAGMSLGRAMGEWLADTLDGAQFVAEKMEQARAAPKVVAREMHAYALGLADETGALMEKVRQEGVRARRDARSAPAVPADPPPRLVIRGGKSPAAGKGKRA